MREKFIDWRPQSGTLALIEQANEIIDEYEAQGFVLTARQLFYQFVARDWLPNTHGDYKRLYRIVGDARDAGLIDWDAIEDRTREVVTHTSWASPDEIIGSCADDYQEDLWAGQEYRPEVWIEKDALLGVIEGVCTEYRVPYFATRGNASATLLYEAGKRFARYLDQGLIPVVLHLADHDPKGVDMTRDLEERLARYARQEIEVRRIALTRAQVRRYRLPPNFTKEKDKLTPKYRAQFGTDECWELDALSPTVIADLIRSEIEGLIEAKAWKRAQAGEKRGIKLITRVSENWSEVTTMLQRGGGRGRSASDTAGEASVRSAAAGNGATGARVEERRGEDDGEARRTEGQEAQAA